MHQKLHKIVSAFEINDQVESISSISGGHIHESFLVKTKGDTSFDYMLQHKNKNVFRDVPAMMKNISLVTSHLKNKYKKISSDPLRHTLTIIPTREKQHYHVDEEGEYWTMCLFIKDTVCYANPVDSKMAHSGGRITGEFHSLLADFRGELTDVLPGFHNMRFRFEQWDDIIGRTSEKFKSQHGREIDWVESRREEMMKFQVLIENGKIPVRVVHNDAKLLNVLFDKEDEAICMIDLDTVLFGSVLYDFGDAIRSYTNMGLEDDKDPKNVFMNMDYFGAFTRGYLRKASSFLTEFEAENLAFAARFITFEQFLRFLMDYFDGDKYYRVSYPGHNLVRATAQYSLLESFEKNFRNMANFVCEEFIQYD